MGCCEAKRHDLEIKTAINKRELIIVLKDKINYCMIEYRDIQTILGKSSSDKESLKEEELKKRLVHIKIMEKCLETVVELLEKNKKPYDILETKEHMYNIYSHYYNTDDSEYFINEDLEKFKAFIGHFNLFGK